MNDYDLKPSTATSNLVTTAYLMLSFASGFLELGIVIFVLRQDMSLVTVPILGLAYQLGALFCRPLKLPLPLYAAAAAVALVLGLTATESTAALFFAVLLLSIGLQGGRELASSQFRFGTFTKRVSRVAGFAVSGFFGLHVLVGIAGLLILNLALLARIGAVAEVPKLEHRWRPGFLGATMVIHQSHYFAYAYFIPFLFLVTHNIDASIVGLLFCIGWVSYTSIPFILGKASPIVVFVAGHLLAAATLFTIFGFSQSLPVILVAWFLSGFGGGTVFFLRKLAEIDTTEHPELDLWEDIGHIIGLVLCLLLIVIANQATNVFAAAGSIAFVAALLLPIWSLRKNSMRF